MKALTKTRRFVLIGLIIGLFGLGGIVVGPLKRVGEFCYAETVKGYWASLQPFVHDNGRYPTNEAEIGTVFHIPPEQLKLEAVEYVAPHSTNADEVVIWCKKKTVFGVRIGITESGMIVKQ